MRYLRISESNKATVLELFNKAVDSAGYIINKVNKVRIRCPYSNQPIKADSFSILPGSAVFVNNYSYCFSEHLIKHQ